MTRWRQCTRPYPNAHTLVTPNVAAYREVSALLTKNADLPPGGDDYEWPAVTHDELATATIRVVAAPDPGAAGDDDYRVELEHAWLDLYGWEKSRPAEVFGLLVNRLPGGDLDLSFDELGGAERYNLPGGSFRVDLGNEFVWGALLGLDIPLSQSKLWGLHLGGRYVDLEADSNGKLDINPLILEAGFFRRF